ncbi:hypothetical protein CY35_10G085300 [Sphagnum magellanicum]|nr:hypothetical protein CY35_10G085300 [Sphagnum magellanicum]
MMETVLSAASSAVAIRPPVASSSLSSSSSSSAPAVCGAASLSSSMALSSPFLGSPMPWARTGMKASYRKVSQIFLFAPRATDVSKLTTKTTTSSVAPYASYAVPLESSKESSFITRPLYEILRDMNKRVPDKVLKVKNDNGVSLKYIPWYHANRMLSFYAPGWSGEIRSITFAADSSTVSVVYRVTIRGSDGEAWRESSGTASVSDTQFGDPVQKAEGMAFRRACARFGLGLYLYHEEEVL